MLTSKNIFGEVDVINLKRKKRFKILRTMAKGRKTSNQ